ncbi:T9SS type B sorting domain-containing protein [Formosa undariae]|uniref:T9SS type B sorting domain-containing protein n=1 Tax=Formosa undariae TaxID=1325436 RepID=A0ABV5F0Q4_9FLAO
MKNYLIAILFLLHGIVYAQYEAANWYFGEYAGINFNSNTNQVTPILNGKLNTKEGSSSISDANGNLLFYTDGITVYNKTHDIMDNGSYLYGDPSSTQSAIVVPKPNNPDIFYVFTVGSSVGGAGNNRGFNYSIIDISANSGLGRVTAKNRNLLAYSSEKISAVVKDCYGNSIWVITLSTASGSQSSNLFNTFYAYEITDAAGISTKAVKSTISSRISDPRGALKLSPDGTKLISANMQDGLFLYDFDPDTGLVTNSQQISITSTNNSTKSYGVEFSPNNKFLYVHASNDNNTGTSTAASSHYSSLLQYDLEAVNISNSQIVLDNRNLFRGALQLGPDGKIYRALASTYNIGLPYLGVINNPNIEGVSAQYVHNAINLRGNNSTQGLPPFIQSFFDQKIDIINASNGIETSNLDLCIGDTYTLRAQNIVGADYKWTFNGAPLTNATNPWEMEASQEGLYKVNITPPSGTICDRLEGDAFVTYYDIPTANTIIVDNICDFDNDSLEIVDLTDQDNHILNGQDPSIYQVSYFKRDTNGNENLISDPTRFQITAINQEIIAKVENINNTNCSATTSFTLNLIPSPVIVVQDISQCDGTFPYTDGLSTFNLEEAITTSNGTYQFFITDPNTASTSPAITHPEAFTNTVANQVIFVRAINIMGCYTDRSFILNTQVPIITYETAYYCTGSRVVLNAGITITAQSDYTYQWYLNNVVISGETQHKFTTDSADTYEVVITNNATNCVIIKRITAEESGVAVIDLVNTKVSYSNNNNNISVSASGLGTYEYALFKNQDHLLSSMLYRGYQSNPVFTDVSPGVYSIKVKDIKNNCGLSEHVVYVVGFTLFFTPNGDGYNDTFKIEGADQMFMAKSRVNIFDRYGKLLKVLNLNEPNWDGKLNGIDLPQDDYWFSATLSDGRKFTSHFSLKR